MPLLKQVTTDAILRNLAVYQSYYAHNGIRTLQSIFQPLCHVESSVARKVQKTVYEVNTMKSEDLYTIMIRTYTTGHATAKDSFCSQVAHLQMKGQFNCDNVGTFFQTRNVCMDRFNNFPAVSEKAKVK